MRANSQNPRQYTDRMVKTRWWHQMDQPETGIPVRPKYESIHWQDCKVLLKTLLWFANFRAIANRGTCTRIREDSKWKRLLLLNLQRIRSTEASELGLWFLSIKTCLH